MNKRTVRMAVCVNAAFVAAMVQTMTPSLAGGNGQGQVVFGNLVPSANVDAPIILPDGKGAGFQPGMVAQLFLVSEERLLAIESKSTFWNPATDTHSIRYSYILHYTPVVPVDPGEIATFRLRAWEETKGATYEAARENGGYFGETEVTVMVGGGVIPPSNLLGLSGFVLQRRERLAIEASESGALLSLDALDGVHYTIETSTDMFHWEPLPKESPHALSLDAPLPAIEPRRFFRALTEVPALPGPIDEE